MNARAIRASLVALALAGFVAAVVAVAQRPPTPTPGAARVVERVAEVELPPGVHQDAVAHAATQPTRGGPACGPFPRTVVPSAPAASPGDAPLRDDQVMSGLRWLQDHQLLDGSWHDPATTGIALFTFFGAGETHQTGSFRDTVKRGLNYLRNLQGADGCLAPRDSPRMLRDHAIGGLALVEAYGMTGSRVFREPAQRAVAFAMKTRTPSSGWMRPDGRLDFEATVWMSMVAKSAKFSGLDVDETVLADAVGAIDQMTDHATGRVASPSVEISDEAATAMGMFVRVLAGHASATDEAIRKGAAVLAAKPPATRDGRVVDPAACYFGTIVMHNALDDAHYTPWAKALISVLGSAQSTSETPGQRAFWLPPQTDASETDRIWTTAYVLLGTERVAYAYRRLIK